MPEPIDYSEQLANIRKYKAIVEFKDGEIKESPWYYSDIHCRDFASDFFDDAMYLSYEIKEKVFKEDISKIEVGPNPNLK